MKNKKAFISISFALILITIIVLLVVLLPKKSRVYQQELDYTESLEQVLNPDQGFYRTSYVSLYPDHANTSLSLDDNFQLYHLRMDISEFSGAVNGESDLELTDTALAEVENIIAYYKEMGRNVVIRFSYDTAFEGNANLEPQVQMIITHIKQLCPIFNEYQSTITAIEAGMIGPWGEMHTSTIANAETINQIIDAYLANTIELPILVRTPQMIYNYLGISIDDIDNYEIEKNSPAYRLGLFNDGYLGSDSDLGTYQDREREVTWLAKQTEHLPFGGEVTSPESSLHDIDKCLPEMYALNLSYLNYEWNYNIVQDKWQNSFYTEECGSDSNYYGKTAYTYIQNRLGYRLVLRDSVFKYNNNLKNFEIELTIENVGFGNFYREKDIEIIFVDEIGESFTIGGGKYYGETKLKLALAPAIEKQNYDVFIRLSTIEDGNSTYSVKFANNNIFNSTLNANYIGKIEF